MDGHKFPCGYLEKKKKLSDLKNEIDKLNMLKSTLHWLLELSLFYIGNAPNIGIITIYII